MSTREVLLAGALAAMTGLLGSQTIAREAQLANPAASQTPLLHGATGWLNSPPLIEGAVRGKVILVDFWTYTCVNWRRTLPYLRAWAEKYQNQGLVVIGVHTPEFSFEKDVDNVRRA